MKQERFVFHNKDGIEKGILDTKTGKLYVDIEIIENVLVNPFKQGLDRISKRLNGDKGI